MACGADSYSPVTRARSCDGETEFLAYVAQAGLVAHRTHSLRSGGQNGPDNQFCRTRESATFRGHPGQGPIYGSIRNKNESKSNMIRRPPNKPPPVPIGRADGETRGHRVPGPACAGRRANLRQPQSTKQTGLGSVASNSGNVVTFFKGEFRDGIK
jgi:hypothetical protein